MCLMIVSEYMLDALHPSAHLTHLPATPPISSSPPPVSSRVSAHPAASAATRTRDGCQRRASVFRRHAVLSFVSCLCASVLVARYTRPSTAIFHRPQPASRSFFPDTPPRFFRLRATENHSSASPQRLPPASPVTFIRTLTPLLPSPQHRGLLSYAALNAPAAHAGEHRLGKALLPPPARLCP